MKDELLLKTGGRMISGWQDISVTRSIERLPSAFDIALMDRYPASQFMQWVNPGDPCEVWLGDDRAITGYVDQWCPSISPSRHGIRATGRGKCEDLVDCSAWWEGNVISQANALQIAQRLAAPYGIAVTSDVDDLVTVPQFVLNWGESSQEVIDRIARFSALLYYDLPDGSLFMTRTGTRRAASGVAMGVNVQHADYKSSRDERFSDYTGISMSVTPLNEAGGGGYDPVTLSTARDPEADSMRYRNHVTLLENTMWSPEMAKRCIDWEMNRRYGRSRVVNVTVDSWRDSGGALWEPNTLAPVSLQAFGIQDEEWLISEVTFRRSPAGTTAELTLMPPEAFVVQPYAFYQQIGELTNHA
ncbi:phage tail protein [Salmonella enterica]|nr:phage tail protein [Salmonella enterica]EGL7479598.1 phage tail protein [Salmonella enterica]EIZ2335800.1 phage tail protein [Salmonella enterica]